MAMVGSRIFGKGKRNDAGRTRLVEDQQEQEVYGKGSWIVLGKEEKEAKG